MNVRLPKDEDIHIANTKDIARIMRKILLRQNRLHRKKEYFWAIGLSTANNIEYIELLTIGTLNKNSVKPIDVFNFAVAKKCEKIIVCHNHPSGNIEPSKDDIAMTQLLTAGATVLGIQLLDSIIISEDKEYTSIKNKS